MVLQGAEVTKLTKLATASSPLTQAHEPGCIPGGIVNTCSCGLLQRQMKFLNSKAEEKVGNEPAKCPMCGGTGKLTAGACPHCTPGPVRPLVEAAPVEQGDRCAYRECGRPSVARIGGQAYCRDHVNKTLPEDEAQLRARLAVKLKRKDRVDEERRLSAVKLTMSKWELRELVREAAQMAVGKVNPSMVYTLEDADEVAKALVPG